VTDVLIIGAGPCGISAAIECKRAGLEPLIIEKGCIVNSIYHFPMKMTFFSTPEKIELAGIPFPSVHERPTREEALEYYRKLVHYFDLKVRTYEKVVQITRTDPGFEVVTESRLGKRTYQAPYVVVATGYYDNPNRMNIPGEDLPHVYHYFQDAHPFSEQKVVVIGGRNSAIDVALEMQRVGADVTMVYRRGSFHDSVKAWVRPVIESAIHHGRVKMKWNSQVKEIRPDCVVIEQEGRIEEIPADAVFAMTGYRPDLSLLEQAGAKIDPKTLVPVYSESMETTVPGLYLAGVVASGNDSTRIFIENGRFHGEMIVKDILRKRGGSGK
jgi:thioredoxin reductase (NADPH)